VTTASFLRSLRLAIWQAMSNDVLDNAKAVAYSGMLMLFPSFLVLTMVLAAVPAGTDLLDDLRGVSERILPGDTMSLLLLYFQGKHAFSFQVFLSATSLSLFAGWSVMSTFMDAFRRAYRLPANPKSSRSWSYWQQRIRALLLVPIALVPLSMASLFVIFGQPIEQWMISHSGHDLHIFVRITWRLARWSLALLTSASVLGALYHYGTNSRERWIYIAPGAITGTLLWFPITLAFGLYVTRVANYTVIYGSLGTAIATLVWLYLTSFSVLLGAQLNGVLYRKRRKSAYLAKVGASLASASHSSPGEHPQPLS
jgi:membrane protein